MTRTAKLTNLAAVIVPPVVILLAVVLLWGKAVGPVDLALLAVMYLLTGFGVTIGFHRLLTHRALQARDGVRYAFAVLGSMSVQGPVINWVADHRKHHAHTDKEGDPHSPHVGRGKGLKGALRGLAHAHVGWLWTEHGRAVRHKYAPELMEDRGMRRINGAFELIVLAGLLLPALVGGLVTWSVTGALTGLLWGGLVRVFLLHHVTWSINSICHFWGTRRFATDDHSTNVFWLALPSLGEAWHHNHHAFPRAAVHGLRRLELDPSGWLIALLERLGLVWDVVRITPERQRAKLAA